MLVEKIKSVMLGHAVGDALGVPVEFLSRSELDINPVTKMTGNGTWPVPKGTWSDDTSMSLGTLVALVNYGVNYDKIFENFAKWYYRGEFTATGRAFDVGNACRISIRNYFEEGLPWYDAGTKGEFSNGNGSLMRIHPAVLYLSDKNLSLDKKLEIIHNVSSLTHAHKRSKIACGIYAFVLWEILISQSKQAVFLGLKKAQEFYKEEDELIHFDRLFSQSFIETNISLIKSSGYVVDTLESSIWCLLTTETYKDCVLKAVNLGEDTDTVGAVAGGLAGALYGYDSIPKEWKDDLLKLDYIEFLCEKASLRF